MAIALRTDDTMTMDAAQQVRERADEQSARNITQLQTRVQTIKTAKVDGIVDTRSLRAIALASGDHHAAQVVLDVPTRDGTLRMQVGDVANDQFAYRLKIDKKYYDRMQTNAPELLAQNLNWWFAHEPEERLLRMLKPDALDDTQRAELASTGAVVKLRGVLGKSYRTIDDADLCAAIVPSLVERGAKLVDFSIDDRRLHAKFVTDIVTMDELRARYAAAYGLTVEQVRRHFKVNGKDVSWIDEPLGYGVTIRHSEVGFASLGVSFVERIGKCLNDYVSENAIAIRHTGGKNGGGAEDGDVRYVSNATQALDNAALLSRVQDTIAREFDPKRAIEVAQKVIGAKVTMLDRPNDVPLMEFVGDIGVALGLSEGETSLLQEETVKSIAVEGNETQFAHVQGITALARQMTNYDRRLEVERVGFTLLNDDVSALVNLARSAEKRTRKGGNN